MAKRKLIFLGFLVICLGLGSAAPSMPAYGQGLQNTSNQSTQMDTINTDWQNDQKIPETYQLTAENTQFQLYIDQASLGFIVVDKRSGYVWHSILDEKIDGDRLNKAWTAFAQSGISIDYLDEKAVSKRISITNSNHTIDVKPVDLGIEATVNFTDFSISVAVRISLEESGVSVEIPFDLIKEDGPVYKLGNLYVYPFFGATRADTVPGYMFIPDGSGALIRFSAATKATNMYYGKYYGADLGMITIIPWDPTINRPYILTNPVFGMVHGYKQNGFIAITEKGASYGELQVHPSGIITNFNFMYNTFLYNESYFQATNRSGAGVTILQRAPNAFDIRMHYRFLTGADSDYVGMAKSYQQYLVDRGSLTRLANPGKDIGIRLEFLGGEKEKVLIWNRLISMTTVSQMSAILADLGIQNVDVTYFGWQPLGAATMYPRTLKLDRGLGSLDELRRLVEKIQAGGGNFYLYYDPQAALADQGGYSPRNDLAMSITDETLKGWNRSGRTYFFNFNALSKHYTSLSRDVFSSLNAGLSLDYIGTTLYSDFKASSFLNREDAIQKYQGLLGENQVPMAIYQPNDYLFGQMKAYYDMPLTNSGYIYTTDLVPFLQIVLAGYVPYFGPAMNFSSNSRLDLLRQVDFGIYPSYFLTQEPTAKILNTLSNWIYTSSYQQWGEEIKTTYLWMDSLLGPVAGQEITAREVLEPGIVATTYSSGQSIIVNYTSQPFSIGDTIVNSNDAALVEVLP